MDRENYSFVLRKKIFATCVICATILLCTIVWCISSIYSSYSTNQKSERAESGDITIIKEACKAAINNIKNGN